MRIATLLGAGALLLLGNTAFSQQLKLGLNPYTVQKSALLELNSTNQGLLLARIADTTSINTLAPPDGMLIFFTPTRQLMIRANSGWQALTMVGGDITSLNGLTVTSQTFATGTSGTDFGISSTGSVHTFNMPSASATARGVVTTGAQTFAGSKTFTSATNISAALSVGGVTNISATNPLSLFGVAAGTSTTADSLLTITSGLVRKIPMSTFSTTSGITSLNGLTTTTQTFATGTSGTDFGITSSGSAHTFNIPDASATNRGVVTIGAQTFAGSKTFTSATNISAPLNVSGATNISATNPLNLFGVALGTNTSTDSILTISSGVVKKLPASTFSTSAGITTLNGLTGAVQTFATGNTGTDFSISSSGTAHTFNIPDASATARGVVTTGAQTFAGSKTFTSATNISAPLNISGATNISATNPLNLFGVALGTNTSTDSILTISSGVVKKLPASTFSTSAGITTLNGLTGAVQTFATGTSGTDFGITSSGSAHTFNIPDASATARGLVTTGAQTFAGSKTFTSTTNISAPLNISGATNISATNPLNLFGVALGTNTSTDSILTISSGVVKKLPASTFSTSAGITTLNGLTGAVQTFATGTSGTDFGITSSGSAHTFNIPDASATARGLVTTGIQTLSGSKTITSASNPLSLLGVQAGTSTTADSILTITSGLVRKIPMSTFSTTSGITSLNGLTTATQTFATGTSGTDFGITSSGSAHTFNIPDASATARGVVTTGAQTFAGTKAFTSAVSVSSTNPLNLFGVALGTNTSTDSVLTISSGVVKKLPASTFSTSAGITTLNGLTGAVQTFATGTSGTDFGITSSGSAHIFNIPDASATNRGVVTIGAQTFAGSKTFTSATNISAPLNVSGATNISATNPLNLFGVALGTNTSTDSILTISSGVVKKLPASTFSTSAGITTLNGLTGAVQTFATGNTGTDFTITSSGSTHTFNIPDASTSNRGVVTTGAQTFSGSKTFSSAPTFSSLTPGGVLYTATGGLVSQSNAAFFWDATNNRLGIGTAAPTTTLHVVGTNPLTLTGVQTGTTTDSILTITSGTVRKLAFSTVSPGGITGTTNFIPKFTSSSTIGNSTVQDDGSLVSTTAANGILATGVFGSGGVPAIAGAGTRMMWIPSRASFRAGSVISNQWDSANIGSYSVALGRSTIASGLASTAFGLQTTASGQSSTALGQFSVASGSYSTAIGSNISTNSFAGSMILGDGNSTVTNNDQANQLVTRFTGGYKFFTDIAGTAAATGVVIAPTTGNVGIGTGAPSTALHVVGTNPLTLVGVQTGTSTTADSLLTITSGLVRKIPMSTFSSASNFWALGGNNTGGVKNFGTLDNNPLPFITSGAEHMRISNVGDVGIGVTDPGNNLVVKDTMEIRRVGALSEILFSNTAGTGDFRIGGDGGDIFWQGGGGRMLQMGAYWTVVLGGDRQSGAFPAFISGTNNNTGVLVQAQRDASIPLAIAPNSASQTANLTEWRSSTGAVLNAIDKSGNLGLGTSAPATKLHVMGTNPLSLYGVQAGTSTTADSLLTITSGLVRKIPMSTFSSASNFWALGGNTVGAVKTFGTVDAFDLPFITGNTERMRLSSAGNLGIGSTTFNSTAPEKLLVQAGTTSSFNLIGGHGRINNYLQFNIMNDSAGTNASSDLVATADNGSESVNFVDLGINSSAFTGTGVIGGANNAYLYSTGNDFSIGNGTSGKSLLFFTGGVGSNERMRITGTGTVGINTTTPAAQLDVAGTYKLGSTGTANKNIISYTYTVPAGGLALPAGVTGTVIIIGTVTYASGTLDVNSTIPSTNLPGTTRATVSVSPDQDLPASVLIASSRLSSTSNVRIRFLNSSTNAATLPAGLNLFITITEF